MRLKIICTLLTTEWKSSFLVRSVIIYGCPRFKPTFEFLYQAISSCGEGENSPNTLFVGLILNSCLIALFVLVLFYFNHRRNIHFYFDLYFRRIRGNRKPSQKYKLKHGIILAISRLSVAGIQDEETTLNLRKDKYNISFEKLSLVLTSVS